MSEQSWEQYAANSPNRWQQWTEQQIPNTSPSLPQAVHPLYQPANVYPASVEEEVTSPQPWMRWNIPRDLIARGGLNLERKPTSYGKIDRYFGEGYMAPYLNDDGEMIDPNWNPLAPSANQMGAVEDLSPEIRNIYELMNGPGGARGALERLIDLQWTDPEKVTAIQMELMHHGFFATDGGQIDLGRVDQHTAQAVATMFAGKFQTHGDETFNQYMNHRREQTQLAQFGEMQNDLAAFDQAAADELQGLRDSIEQMDLSISLSDPVGLEQNIQAEAVATIGRRLKSSEVQGLIENIHGKERQDYYDNSPEYRLYQQRLKQLQYATTSLAEDREAVINGDRPADLDQFMMAISAQESGGDPNALNADSGAFGKYQFMPATWAAEARLAGLNPNDRSEENQDAMAYHMAARYFKMFGSWYSVAQAWYAGPASGAIGGGAVGNKSQGKYPTINSYAEQITERMVNGGQLEVDQAYAAADAGSLGGATASEQGLGPEELAGWWEQRQAASAAMVDDGAGGLATDPNSYLNAAMSTPSVGESYAFDMQAYLRQQVEQAGGVDTDAFRFANAAQDWYSALEAR